MLTACIFGGALVPAYIFVRNDSLIACTFFEQFFVGGVWGPMPIHLIELCPPALRTFMYGVTYQLGNLASAASSTIEATIGERFPLPPSKTGEKRYDYGKVIGIFLGAVWAYIFFFVFFGPEMTQDERNEEAQVVLSLEDQRRAGVSLQEIGASRAKYHMDSKLVIAGETEFIEREKAAVDHIEGA